MIFFKRTAITTLYLSLCALTACSSAPTVSKVPVDSGERCYAESDKNRNVRLDLIRQQVAEGQYFSAIAHLEREDFQSDGARFLLAESLRKSGQLDAALTEYNTLKRGCLNALGYLGAGKVLAVTGNLEQGLAELKTARDLLPTDANIRNDYGFALLASGSFDTARHEFMTAVELQPGHPVAIRNLVLALILSSDTQTAWSVAEHHHISVDDFQNLVVKAAQFRRNLSQNRASRVAKVPAANTEPTVLIRLGETL
ncbi:tetratricopeptide repeat protein [Litorivivens sp.]|uniref:tetratricopeptide repeat protein n=1 Tax=Litorivivens sp. TaxID=2020868 RepID=UPI0035680C37